MGIGVLQASDRGEDLRYSDEEVRRNLPSDCYVIVLLAGSTSIVSKGVIWSRRIDEMLDERCPCHSERSTEETTGDSHDGFESDVESSQRRIDQLIEDRNEDDQYDRINVL